MERWPQVYCGTILPSVFILIVRWRVSHTAMIQHTCFIFFFSPTPLSTHCFFWKKNSSDDGSFFLNYFRKKKWNLNKTKKKRKRNSYVLCLLSFLRLLIKLDDDDEIGLLCIDSVSCCAGRIIKKRHVQSRRSFESNLLPTDKMNSKMGIDGHDEIRTTAAYQARPRRFSDSFNTEEIATTTRCNQWSGGDGRGLPQNPEG